jgi:hypothetical protein
MEIKLKMNVSKTGNKKIELQARYSALDKEVKKNVKNDHQKWTDDKAEKAEAATNRGDVKELYNITKLLAKKKFNSSGLVRNKEGLLKATERESSCGDGRNISTKSQIKDLNHKSQN